MRENRDVESYTARYCRGVLLSHDAQSDRGAKNPRADVTQVTEKSFAYLIAAASLFYSHTVRIAFLDLRQELPPPPPRPSIGESHRYFEPCPPAIRIDIYLQGVIPISPLDIHKRTVSPYRSNSAVYFMSR